MELLILIVELLILAIAVAVAVAIWIRIVHVVVASAATPQTDTPPVSAESVDTMSYDTSTVRLVPHDRGEPILEVSLHVRTLGEMLQYHGRTYKRRHKLAAGIRVYDEVKA